MQTGMAVRPPDRTVLLLFSHGGVSGRSRSRSRGGVSRSGGGGVSGGRGGGCSVGRRGGFSGGGRSVSGRSGFFGGLAAGGQRGHGGHGGHSQSDFLHYDSPEMTERTPDATTAPESSLGHSAAYARRNR